MNRTHKAVVSVKGTQVTVLDHHEQDYISLTDIARHKDAERTDYLISNWLRNRNTIEFLGIWEVLNNPTFNPIEFDGIRKNAGLNSFVLSADLFQESERAGVYRLSVGRLRDELHPRQAPVRLPRLPLGFDVETLKEHEGAEAIRELNTALCEEYKTDARIRGKDEG